jgi:hypothetical protein
MAYIILYQQCQHFQRFQNPNLRFHGISDILYQLISHRNPTENHLPEIPRNSQHLSQTTGRQRVPTSGLPRQFCASHVDRLPWPHPWVKGIKIPWLSWEKAIKITGTLWLFNRHSHGKIHHCYIIGKPSISMGHLYHGYVTNNRRVNVNSMAVSKKLPL